MDRLPIDAIKKKVATKALEFIHDGMIVGLGTGTTVYFFIEALGLLCQRGLNIKAAASSNESTELAMKWNIPLLDPDHVHFLDVTVDGADEVDDENNMIKGGGGALLREKVLAESSEKMIVIVDESKLSKKLGKQKLPIEILPFCFPATIEKIKRLGFQGKIRLKQDHTFFRTDNKNFIYDVHFPEKKQPKEAHEILISVPGVMETGIFTGLSPTLIIGYPDGKVEICE